MNEDDEPDDNEEDLGPSALEPTVDAGTPEGHRKQQNDAARKLRERQEFWRGALSTAIGRREIWWLIASTEGAHAFETRFMAGPSGFPDPNATWYARGEQDLGLRLYRFLSSIDQEAVLLMHSENDQYFAEPPKKPRRKRAQ